MSNEERPDVSPFVVSSTTRPPSAASPEASERMASQKNLEKVKHVVKMKQNPHPATVVLGFLLVIMIVYVFWIIICRSSPKGIWVDKDTKVRYEIQHGKLSGCLYITDGEVESRGRLYDGTLVLDSDPDKVGVWSGNNIFWTGNGGHVQVWRRELYVHA